MFYYFFVMKNLSLLFILLLFSASAAFAQNTECKLTLNEVPTIRGLRLNMSLSELEKKSALVNKKETDRGEIEGVIRFDDNTLYNLAFVNNRLYRIYATYPAFVNKFSSVKDFVAILSKNFGFPDNWKTPFVNNRMLENSREMRCDGFGISASVYPEEYPSLHLYIKPNSIEFKP